MTSNTGLAIFVLVLSSVAVRAEVEFEWSTVGNPGNGPDDTGFGAVDYVYCISKYEVTNAQYTEFLNTVDPKGMNPNLAGDFLYDARMFHDSNGGIIFNTDATNGSKYQVKSGRDNSPVVFVSYFDAMRFTNWLENGQGSGSTEAGVYTIGNGVNETRNPNATFFIPTENEWYKAAYHKNDGVTANYWDYPTSADAEPYSAPPASVVPPQSNTANFIKDDGLTNGYDNGYAVTGALAFNVSQNYLTDVGAYSLAASPYGTFDQGGNVMEFNEAIYDTSIAPSRVVRGGFWAFFAIGLSASYRNGIEPIGAETEFTGFRVARIPESDAGSLELLGAMVFLRRRRHRRVTRLPREN